MNPSTHAHVLLPDALLLFAVLLIWINDIVTGAKSALGHRSRCATYAIAVGASVVSAIGYLVLAVDQHVYHFFANMYVVDPLAHLIKAFVTAGFAISLVYSRQYIEARGLFRGEFYLLAMFSLLGQLVMISGHHLLTLYLGLELMSLSLYGVIALQRDSIQSADVKHKHFEYLPSENAASEAAFKYYVLGALASGFLLYGISMIYGATGSLELTDVFHVVSFNPFNAGNHFHHVAHPTVLLLGLAFIIAGLAFKLGAVPFHMWVPDVYHGAPTAMTLLVGAGPKVAAFAWSTRFLVSGLFPLAPHWQQMLIVPAALSLIVGNLIGIVQKNIKRMLAYSAISNMGFVLLGLLSGGVNNNVHAVGGADNAYSSAMFYSIVYLITTLGAFGIVLLLARRGFEADQIDDLKGLTQRHSGFAWVMLVMMFSLAGIPPTAGFYAKFAVLAATVNAGLIWLAVLAVIASLFGAFYYLRIVKLMFFDAPADHPSIPIPADSNAAQRLLLIVNGIIVVALGILPGPLMSMCLYAIRPVLSLS